MQLNDLIGISLYLTELNKKYNYSNLFDQLGNTLNQLAQNKNQPQHHEQMVTQKKSLYKAILDLGPKGWNIGKKKLYVKFCSPENIGQNLIDRIEEGFQDNMANPAGARQELLKIKNEFMGVITRSNSLHSSLTPLIEEYEEDHEIEEDELAIQLIFDGDINVADIHDLAVNSKEWDKIFQFFTVITNEPSKKPRLLSIDKGSLIVEVAAYTAIVGAIGLTVNTVLDWVKKYYEIEEAKSKSESSDMDVKIKKTILVQFDQALKKTEEDATKDVKGKLLAEFKSKSKDTSRQKAIDEVVKYVFNFVLKGGSVDIREPEQEVEEETENQEEKRITSETILQIKDNFEKVRSFQEEYGPRLLTLIKNDDEEENDE